MKLKWRPDMGLRAAVQAASALAAVECVAWVFHLERAYWAELSAVLMIGPTCGEALLKSRRRLMGTLFGASLATALYLFAPGWAEPGLYALIAFAAVMAVYEFPADYGTYVFWLCLGLLLALDLLSGDASIAWVRVYETVIGCGAGVLASVLVLPSSGTEDAAREMAPLLKAARDAFAAAVEGVCGAGGTPAGGASGLAVRAERLALKKGALEAEEAFAFHGVARLSESVVILKALSLQGASFLEESLDSGLRQRPSEGFSPYLRRASACVLEDFDSVLAALEADASPPVIGGREDVRAAIREEIWEEFSRSPGLKASSAPALAALYWTWVMHGTLRQLAASMRGSGAPICQNGAGAVS